MKIDTVLAGIGLTVGIIGLAAQLSAPNCPSCGRKLVVINNYCINCKTHWEMKR